MRDESTCKGNESDDACNVCHKNCLILLPSTSEPESPKDLESFVMEKQIQIVAKTYEGNLKLNAVMVKFEDEATISKLELDSCFLGNYTLLSHGRILYIFLNSRPNQHLGIAYKVSQSDVMLLVCYSSYEYLLAN